MGLRFLPRPIARYDQSLLPVLNENFQQLVRLLAQVPSETVSNLPPDTPYLGQPWFDTAENQPKWWDGTDWVPDKPGTDFTPNMVQGVVLTKTVPYSKYWKWGRMFDFQSVLNITSAGTLAGIISIALPFTLTYAGSRTIGFGHYYDASAGVNLTFKAYANTTTSVAFIIDGSPGILGPAGFPAGQAAANGDTLTVCIRAEATT